MFQFNLVSIYSQYYVIIRLLLFLTMTSSIFLLYDVQNTECHGDKSIKRIGLIL